MEFTLSNRTLVVFHNDMAYLRPINTNPDIRVEDAGERYLVFSGKGSYSIDKNRPLVSLIELAPGVTSLKVTVEKIPFRNITLGEDDGLGINILTAALDRATKIAVNGHKYGIEPRRLGRFEDVGTKEFTYIQDMPIYMPEVRDLRIPRYAEWTRPLVDAIGWDIDRHYVYLSAKHMIVGPGNPGNRPGWHTDQFGTNDHTYIWTNLNPTEFAIQDFGDISEDDMLSIDDMSSQIDESKIVTYQPYELLELDPYVVHRVNANPVPGMRTFVKITVSERQFNMEGNTHNHWFDYAWDMVPRNADRNLTSK